MKKREPKQLTVQRMMPLLSLNEIEKGRKIFLEADQTKVHWQMNAFIIIGASKTHLLIQDPTKRNQAISWEDLPAYNFKVII